MRWFLYVVIFFFRLATSRPSRFSRYFVFGLTKFIDFRQINRLGTRHSCILVPPKVYVDIDKPIKRVARSHHSLQFQNGIHTHTHTHPVLNNNIIIIIFMIYIYIYYVLINSTCTCTRDRFVYYYMIYR